MVAQAGRVTAGVVLVGGRSSRMGTSKAALEWHGSTLLRRTVGVLSRAMNGPVLVIRAPGQALPDIPPHCHVVDDPEEGRGPLQGISTGLAALVDRVGEFVDHEVGSCRGGARRSAGEGCGREESYRPEAAFVCSTDLPFLHPAFVRRVLTALADDIDVVLPIARGYPQPLAAAYRVSLAPLAADLVTAGELRPAFLYRHRHCRTLRLDDAALLTDPMLAAGDPGLDSLVNVNSPDEYRSARCRLAPKIAVERCGALAGNGSQERRIVRAATVRQAAAAVHLMLDRHVIVALNGDQVSRDADIPLVSGDTVVFAGDAGGASPVTGSGS